MELKYVGNINVSVVDIKNKTFDLLKPYGIISLDNIFSDLNIDRLEKEMN